MHKRRIKGVKHIVVVASGKGGVGKSTVAANLAIMLAKKGYKTALVDADIYGPSMPIIFGLSDAKISVYMRGEQEFMLPVEKYGVKMISLGMLADPKQAVIWRGPLAANALNMMFTNTEWGDIDYMIVDFPPGTGDIQISTLQQYRISAAIVVTTPQIIAVSDARKGADMFTPSKMNVPLLGVVENMSWFTPQNHPDEKYYIFGQGGGEALAREFDTEFLVQIPLVKDVCDSSESGGNLMEMGNPIINAAFEKLAERVYIQLDEEEICECDCDDEDCSNDCNGNCDECSHKHKH